MYDNFQSNKFEDMRIAVNLVVILVGFVETLVVVQ